MFPEIVLKCKYLLVEHYHQSFVAFYIIQTYESVFLDRNVLRQINDTKYLNNNEGKKGWVQSLNVINVKDIIKKLISEDISLDKLFNPRVSLDQTLEILKTLKFNAGANFTLMGAISKAREDIAASKILAQEITIAIKAKEREISTHKIIQPEESSADLNVEKVNPKSIFLSYSWSNKQTVKKLHNMLSQQGFDCWLDDNKMKGGSELFTEIENGITDCKVFIACCSNNYASSINGQREILLACDRKKLIIPIMVAPCDPWPPKGQTGPLLAGKIYIDLSSDEKFEKTIEQLIITLNQTLA